MTNRLANIIVFLIEVGVGILCGAVIAVLALPKRLFRNWLGMAHHNRNGLCRLLSD